MKSIENSAFTREKQQSELFSSYNTAISHLESSKLIEGMSLLNSILESPLIQFPENQEILYGTYISLAEAYYLQKNPLKSLHFFYKSTKVKPNDFKIWMKMSNLCEELVFLKEADFCLQNALNSLSGNAYEKAIYEKMVKIAFWNQDFDGALKKAEFLLKIDENMTDAKIIQALSLENLGRNLEANNILEKLKNEIPNFNLENNEIILKKKQIDLKRIENFEKTNNSYPDEFNLFFEKSGWNSFLETLCVLTKTLILKKNNQLIKSKYRKYGSKFIFDDFLTVSIIWTTIYLKEKSIDPFKIKDFLSSEEKNVIPKKKIQSVIPTKTSQRLQNINKAFENGQNLEENIRISFTKNGLNFENTLKELKSACILGFYDFYNEIEDFFEKNCNFISESEIEENQNNESINNLDKTQKKLMNDNLIDFMRNNHKNINWIDLLSKTIYHFTSTFERNCPIGYVDIFSNQNKYYGPSIYLQNDIKNYIIRLIICLYQICPDTIQNSNSLSFLSFFELLFEYYLKIRNKCKVINNEKLKNISKILKNLSFRFFFDTFNDITIDKAHIVFTKIRIYYILSLFYSNKDFIDLSLLNKIRFLLEKELLNYYKTDSLRLNFSINLFWLNKAIINSQFLSYLDEIIFQQNQINKILELHSEQKLEIYFNLFEKSIKTNLDEALEDYYKKIYDLLIKKKIKFDVFLVCFSKILKIFYSLINKNYEDSRKKAIRVYEGLKIDDLLVNLKLLLQNNDKIKENERLLIEILILLLKLNLINCFLMDFICGQVGLSLSFQIISLILRKSGKIRELSYFFHIFHNIVDIVSNENQILQLHKSIFINKDLISIIINEILNSYIENDSGYKEDEKIFKEIEIKISKKFDYKFFDKDSFEKEIISYFKCWHGLNCIKNDIPSENYDCHSQSIDSIQEIEIFVRMLYIYYPEYFEQNSLKFKLNFQQFLTKSYRFLKENDEKWILCHNLKSIIKDDLINFLENSNENSLKAIFHIRNLGTSCFCYQNCFKNTFNYFYSKIFMLIGKAFLETKISDEENEKIYLTKKNLISAEKMLQIHVCISPNESFGWYFLGKIYLELIFLFYDQIIYYLIPAKFIDLKIYNKKIQSVFYLILNDKVNSSEELKSEILSQLLILNILEFKQNKMKNKIECYKMSEYLNLSHELTIKNKNFFENTKDLRNLYLYHFFIERKDYKIFNWKHNKNYFNKSLFLCSEIERNILDINSEYGFDEYMSLEIRTQTYISIFKTLNTYIKLLKNSSIENKITIYEDLDLFLKEINEHFNEEEKRDDVESKDFNAFLHTKSDNYNNEKLQYLFNSIYNNQIFVSNKTNDEIYKINELLKSILENISNKLINLAFKNMKKKNKFSSNYALSCYYPLKISFLIYNSIPKKEQTLFEDLFNIKTNELVEVYKIEKDPILSQLYHRDISFFLIKYKLFELKSKLGYNKYIELDKLRLLNKKIAKKIIFKTDGEDNYNIILFKLYCGTLKDLLIGLKSYLIIKNDEEEENKIECGKWFGEIINILIKQKSLFKLTMDKDPNLIQLFYSVLDETYNKFFNEKNENKIIIEEENKEDKEKRLIDYFNNFVNRRKKTAKKKEEIPKENEAIII